MCKSYIHIYLASATAYHILYAHICKSYVHISSVTGYHILYAYMCICKPYIHFP